MDGMTINHIVSIDHGSHVKLSGNIFDWSIPAVVFQVHPLEISKILVSMVC